MNKKPCPYCEPFPAQHKQEWLGYFIEEVNNQVERLFGRIKTSWDVEDRIMSLLVRLLCLGRAGRFAVLADNQPDLVSKYKHLYQQARQSGFEVERFYLFGRPTTTYRVCRQGCKQVFDQLPTSKKYPNQQWFVDDKTLFKKFLHGNDHPIPRGQSFVRCSSAKKYSGSIGFPLVVKPARGSLSKHTFYPVHNQTELKRAFNIAKQISPVVIVEEYVSGTLFRATTVCNKLVAAAVRHMAEDGADGVAKALVISGGRIVDVTDSVHPENKKMFEEISEQLGGVLLGLDIIAEDLARPWHEQRFVFIEGNSFPAIAMHHEPDEGQPRNVAGAIWEGLF
jgi:hypothetical protein